MYKLISIDVDETLLNDAAKITLANVEAVKRAVKDGIKVVLNTGRGYTSVQEILKVLGLYQEPNQYVISFNGGAIIENKDLKIIHIEGLEFNIVKQLFNLGTEYYPNECIHIYTLNKLYTWNINKKEEDYLRPRGIQWNELAEPNIDFLKNETITKIIFNIDDSDARMAFSELAHKMINGKFKATYSSNRYVEFNNDTTNKGTGMLYLAEKLGIQPGEIIAIGDNSNDLSMIEDAGMGVAVRNANEQVLAKADYICKRDNNHNAVAEVIDRFIYHKLD